MKFVFDLDGTITSQETLPLIASHFKIEAEISELTRETIQGNIPFVESFIRRVHILGDLPVDQIDRLLGEVELYPNLLKFIKENINSCVIATGNLDCWVKTLVEKVGCKAFTSTAKVKTIK